MKLKPLLPSLREKKRYVVFEIISKTPINSFEAVSKAIKESFLSFLGTKGTAKAGLMILKDKFSIPKHVCESKIHDMSRETGSFTRQKGIVRVNNKHVNDLKACFALIKKIDNKTVVVKSKGVSGVLKKTSKFMEG